MQIGGEGCRLTLRLDRWENPELPSGSDANWVVGDVELAAGSTGRFTGRHPVHIRTDEVERFRDELAGLLERLSGEATLEHLENQFGARVVLTAGSGIRTDQSYLAQTLRGLNAAVAEFSVRGSAYE